MEAHIVFAGMTIDYIVNEVKVKNPLEHNTSNYVGQSGSRSTFVSRGGRVLSFTNLCRFDEQSKEGRPHRMNDYTALAKQYAEKVGVLASPSTSYLDGNYIITGFDYTEDTLGNYTIEWEFTEVVKFNVTAKTFRVWGKATSSASKKKKVKKATISKNTKYLLKTCGTMSKGHKGKKCVQSLQKFLQSKGYYKKHKVDGVFETNTEKAVKSLQKANKLKATGKWDKNTRAYFQKKYKYPTSVEKYASKSVNSAIKKVTGR